MEAQRCSFSKLKKKLSKDSEKLRLPPPGPLLHVLTRRCSSPGQVDQPVRLPECASAVQMGAGPEEGLVTQGRDTFPGQKDSVRHLFPW